MVRSIVLLGSIALSGLLLQAAAEPDTLRVQRSAEIAAPPERVRTLVDALRRAETPTPFGIFPFEGRNVVELVVAPHGDHTEVTWTMRGESRFVARLMGVLVDMDRAIGRDLEAGLAELKGAAEAGATLTSISPARPPGALGARG